MKKRAIALIMVLALTLIPLGNVNDPPPVGNEGVPIMMEMPDDC